MSLLPDNYNSANFEKENDSSQFFGLENDGNKNTIRILGDAERPETFIMGYQAWGTVKGERKKKTTPPTEKGYAEMTEYCADDDNEKVKMIWLTQIYNHTLKCPQVWEIPQKRIRQDLEILLANPKWGDLRNYDITVIRNGKPHDSKTTYSLIADPPIEPPSDEILFAMEEARIDCRAVFGGGYPMGSLDVPTTKVTDDQSNIERLKSNLSSMEKDDENDFKQ